MAQQCQPSTSITGQSAAGEGTTIDMAKSGPAVMAATGGRKQRSSPLQAHIPSWDSERALSHGVKTTRPCSVLRTARARTTAAPRTTRPVALTLRQDRRHLWQAKQATLHLRHDDRIKKVCHIVQIHIPFSLPLSLSCYRDRERGILRKGSFSAKEAGPEPPLLIRGSKAGPSEGFDSRLGALGPQALLLIRGSKAGPSEGFDSRLRALGLRAHH
jgi:hypothetical protein